MEEQRKKILVTAGREMASRGIRAVTMDEIAARLGISKRTIYTYFKDKDAIVEAIFSAHIQHQFSYDAPATGDIVEQLASHLMRTAQHTHSVCRQCTEDLRRFYPSLLHDYLSQRHEQAHRILGGLLSRGVEAGDVRADADLEAAIDLLTELPGLLSRSELHEHLDYPPARLQIALNELIVRGLLTESGLRKAQRVFERWRTTPKED